MAFVRRVDHSSFILSCNLIGQRENKSRYDTEIVLPLGYADVIFRRRESREPEIRLLSQAMCRGKKLSFAMADMSHRTLLRKYIETGMAVKDNYSDGRLSLVMYSKGNNMINMLAETIR